MRPVDTKTIARLRELVGYLSIRKAAELAGTGTTTAWRAKRGLLKPKPQAIDLSRLGLSLSPGKRCRKCGDPMRVKTFRGTCVECELLELGRQGVLEIAE